MSTKVLNPESAVLQQSEGHWQQYLTFIVWKLAKSGVTITVQDMKQFASEGEQILLTHGHIDSIEFKIISREEAERIAAYEATIKGKA